jgi:hypothetical protein
MLGELRSKLRKQSVVVPSVCFLIALLRRSSGWDPPSLWLDDQWMAVALRSIDLPRLWALHVPAPFGFVLLEKAVIHVSQDREWPFQIVPLVAGLAAIPVFYWVLSRVVRHPGVLAVTCLGAACHDVAELYSLRVKHYSFDLLVATALLGLTIGVLQQPSRLRFLRATLASLFAALFSFASLLLSLCCLHVLAASALLRASRPAYARAYVACALGFDAIVAGLYRGYFAGQSSPTMRAFWKKYFLRFDSWESVGSFAYHGLGRFALHALTPWCIALFILVVLGVRAVHRDPGLRPLVYVTGLFYSGLLLGAALQVYPLGPERTSLFAYPLLWLFAAIGCERALLGPDPRAAWRTRVASLVAVYVVAVSMFRPGVTYSDVRDCQAVETALRLRRPGDALLMHQFGLLALAYYGGRPMRIVPSLRVAQQFEAWPDWPELYVLPLEIGGVSLRDDPSGSDAPLLDVVRRNPPRIVFLSTHATDRVDARVLQQLQARGYELEQRVDESPLAHVFLLQRVSSYVATTPCEGEAGCAARRLSSVRRDP